MYKKKACNIIEYCFVFTHRNSYQVQVLKRSRSTTCYDGVARLAVTKWRQLLRRSTSKRLATPYARVRYFWSVLVFTVSSKEVALFQGLQVKKGLQESDEIKIVFFFFEVSVEIQVFNYLLLTKYSIPVLTSILVLQKT